jgi:Holliday junction DNA helicase RuvA
VIAALRGRVLAAGAGTLTVDVGGVGYLLLVTASAARRANAARVGDGEVALLTHLHVRDDALQLFGFATADERALFELLLGVSGVGPKAALAIVSGYAPDQLRRAVVAGDAALFTSVPGVGKKTAERIILDLRDRVGAGALGEADVDRSLRPRRLEEFIGQSTVKEQLAKRYEEAPVSTGLQSNGNVLQIFTSERTGTWTVVRDQVRGPGSSGDLPARRLRPERVKRQRPSGGSRPAPSRSIREHCAGSMPGAKGRF